MDRNTQRRDFKALGLLSLSARRAWIEILKQLLLKTLKAVALRKESVDRNIFAGKAPYMENASLSARRAWIEIVVIVSVRLVNGSLSARRAWIEIRNGGILRPWACCRSPQGERG